MGIWGGPMPGPHIGCAGGGATPAAASVQHWAKCTARYTILKPLDDKKRRSDETFAEIQKCNRQPAASSGGARLTAVGSFQCDMCAISLRLVLIPGHTVVAGWRPLGRPSDWALWVPGVIVWRWRGDRACWHAHRGPMPMPRVGAHAGVRYRWGTMAPCRHRVCKQSVLD